MEAAAVILPAERMAGCAILADNLTGTVDAGSEAVSCPRIVQRREGRRSFRYGQRDGILEDDVGRTDLSGADTGQGDRIGAGMREIQIDYCVTTNRRHIGREEL